MTLPLKVLKRIQRQQLEQAHSKPAPADICSSCKQNPVCVGSTQCQDCISVGAQMGLCRKKKKWGFQ